MLNAVAVENVDRPVVTMNGQRDRNGPLRIDDAFAVSLSDTQMVRDNFELPLRHFGKANPRRSGRRGRKAGGPSNARASAVAKEKCPLRSRHGRERSVSQTFKTDVKGWIILPPFEVELPPFERERHKMVFPHNGFQLQRVPPFFVGRRR